MNFCLGIDLGTTYCCVSYVDDDGIPHIIPSADAMETTPSVIWFDGRAAFVGKKANDRKITPTSPIFEYIKRDIGKPRQINTRYEINGYYYGAMGMSAIILRKLKKEAFRYFKKKGYLQSTAEENSTIINAVITVPAYFGDLQRNETRNAGFAAGLNVIGIINEPTAAAIAYGVNLQISKKILVFDLGGGTLDVTILNVNEGIGTVIASDGADQLGGKDWDELIIDYLYSAFREVAGKDIPDDMGWEVQQKAIQAKLDLTEMEQTTVVISNEENDVELILNRVDTQIRESAFDFDMDEKRPFYFEERSSNLLSLCMTICTRVLEKAGLNWGHIDDIVLAGGSCRMPMIPKMLEELSGRKVQRIIPGFSLDTAISIGAAVYGTNKGSIKDVTSKTIGLELTLNGKKYVEHLIHKNLTLPVSIDETFMAEYNATLKVYEGESSHIDECILRGRLELGNPEGNVKISMKVDIDGMLSVVAGFPPDMQKQLQIKTDDVDIDIMELKEKIIGLDIRI